MNNITLKCPCIGCVHEGDDKTNPPCTLCKDRYAYDAILCGVSKEEFESWFETVPKELLAYPPLEEHRCISEECFRRVLKPTQLCVRCYKALKKGNPGVQKFETKKEIIRKEKIMETFTEFCIMKYKDLRAAAKKFGVNKYYLYTIKSYNIYPSKPMISAMISFMKDNQYE